MPTRENWFEFEVDEGHRAFREKIPADSYKDALTKLQRIYPQALLSFIKEWEKESAYMPESKTPNLKKPEKPQPEPESQHTPRDSKSKNVASPRAQPSTKPYWEVLEVASDANYATIKKAYATKIKAYHPDKVADLGEELIALAEQKTQEIVRAFREAVDALKSKNG